MPSGRIFAVALLVLIVAGAAFFAGWTAADGRGAPPNAAPQAASDAPSIAVGAPPAGDEGAFPQTTEGAGDAWTYFLRRAMTNDTTAEAKEALFAAMVRPDSIRSVKDELLGRDNPWVSPEIKSSFAPQQVSGVQDGDAVRVTAWGTAVSGQVPPDTVKNPLPPSSAWMQLTTRMVWDGGWKITGIHTEYGPMPYTPQIPASAGEVYELLFDPNSRSAF
ncbi:MAG TPA: hypothetical protein VLH10_04045 [Yinghuangia sp.]|nr:hypothetical protein [Yinghuangia sp.]